MTKGEDPGIGQQGPRTLGGEPRQHAAGAVTATIGQEDGLGRTDPGGAANGLFPAADASAPQPTLGVPVERRSPHRPRRRHPVADHQGAVGTELRRPPATHRRRRSGPSARGPQPRHGPRRLDPHTGRLAVEQHGVVDTASPCIVRRSSVGSQYAAPAMTVPVSSRISGTGVAAPVRARRAAPHAAGADLDVEPVGAQQPGQHRRQIGMPSRRPSTRRRDDRRRPRSRWSQSRAAAAGSRRPPNSSTRRPLVVKALLAIRWDRVVHRLHTYWEISGRNAMPAIVLIGAQWGDEGKGKVTDLLGGRVQWVVRYQGGNNAGHTVVLPIGREVRPAPDPVGHPDARRHQRDRQRRRGRPGCC